MQRDCKSLHNWHKTHQLLSLQHWQWRPISWRHVCCLLLANRSLNSQVLSYSIIFGTQAVSYNLSRNSVPQKSLLVDVEDAQWLSIWRYLIWKPSTHVRWDDQMYSADANVNLFGNCPFCASHSTCHNWATRTPSFYSICMARDVSSVKVCWDALSHRNFAHDLLRNGLKIS